MIQFRNLPLSLKYLYLLWDKYAPIVIYTGDPQKSKSTTSWYFNQLLNQSKNHKEWDYKKYCARSIKEYIEMLDQYDGQILVIEEAGKQIKKNTYHDLFNTVFNLANQTQGYLKNLTCIVCPSGVQIAKDHRRMIDMNFEVRDKITPTDIIKAGFRQLIWKDTEEIKRMRKDRDYEVKYEDKIESGEFKVILSSKSSGKVFKIYRSTKKPKSIINPVIYKKQYWDLNEVGLKIKFPNRFSYLKVNWTPKTLEASVPYITWLKRFKKSDIMEDLKTMVGIKPRCKFPGCKNTDLIEWEGILLCHDHAGLDEAGNMYSSQKIEVTNSLNRIESEV